MYSGFRLCVAVALGALLAWPAAAAEVTLAPDLHALVLRGAIAEADLGHVISVYSDAADKPVAMYLNSPGGDFYAAIEIGNWVRSMGIDTYAGRLCESACAYVWLAGTHRYANNLIGIHAPFVRTSFVTVAVPSEGLVDAAWYLSKLGYERALIDAIFTVGATQSNESFPITGPETRYLGIGYEKFAEKPFKDELDRLLAPQSGPTGQQ